MIKVTTVDSWGRESRPESVSVNADAYALIPENLQAPVRVYVPLRGFEQTGPWYLQRELSRRYLRHCRGTIAVNYKDSDLFPVLCPDEEWIRSEEWIHSALNSFIGDVQVVVGLC